LKSNCVSGSDVDAEPTRLVEDAVQVGGRLHKRLIHSRVANKVGIVAACFLHYDRNHRFSTFGENSLGPVWLKRRELALVLQMSRQCTFDCGERGIRFNRPVTSVLRLFRVRLAAKLQNTTFTHPYYSGNRSLDNVFADIAIV